MAANEPVGRWDDAEDAEYEYAHGEITLREWLDRTRDRFQHDLADLYQQALDILADGEPGA